MKKTMLSILLGLTTFFPGIALAQNATVRVPMCLQYPESNTRVPCTGVVPVDPSTGNPKRWEDVFAGGSSSSPSAPAGGTSSTAVPVQNTDGGKIATDAQLVTAVNRLSSILTTLQGTIVTSGTITSSALPSGAATATKQDTMIQNMGTPLQAGGTVKVATPVAATSVAQTGSVTSSAATPTTGTASFASGVATIGPITPELNRALRVLLRGTWTGSVSLGTSTDSCTTIYPLTIGGSVWGVFSANANEVVDVPSVAGVSYCAIATISSGTLNYAVQQ